MPKKCETCRHYRSEPRRSLIVLNGVNTGQHVKAGLLEYCTNDQCTTEEIREMFPERKGMPLDPARDICDRESNGIFVHFEPKTPTTGASFEAVQTPVFCSAQCGFADEFEPDELGINFFQAIGTCPHCSAATVYANGLPTHIAVEFAVTDDWRKTLNEQFRSMSAGGAR